jgi:hypothetical protein
MISEPLTIADMESELHDAANMAEIASRLIEGAGDNTPGGRRLSASELNLLQFAVYHTSDLVKAAKARWDEIHAGERRRE